MDLTPMFFVIIVLDLNYCFESLFILFIKILNLYFHQI
jgi:hypothetical protein